MEAFTKMSEEEGRRHIQQCGNNAVQIMLTTQHGDLFKFNIFWEFHKKSFNKKSILEMLRTHRMDGPKTLEMFFIFCFY